MLFQKKERGQGMVEYALLIVMLAVVVIWMIAAMGGVVDGMYQKITDGFAGLIR
jgi:pilus assembly protein Flp/PilA